MTAAVGIPFVRLRTKRSSGSGAPGVAIVLGDPSSTSLTLTATSHNPWWTIGGAFLVVNNLINWKRPKYHTSRLAHDHPILGLLLMSAYGYHFWGDRLKGKKNGTAPKS